MSFAADHVGMSLRRAVRGAAVAFALAAATGFAPSAAPERPEAPPAEWFEAVGWGAVATGLVVAPLGLVAAAARHARRRD